MQKLAVTLLSDAREAALAETLISEVGAKLKNYEELTTEKRRQSLVEVGKLLGISGIENYQRRQLRSGCPHLRTLKSKSSQKKLPKLSLLNGGCLPAAAYQQLRLWG